MKRFLAIVVPWAAAIFFAAATALLLLRPLMRPSILARAESAPVVLAIHKIARLATVEIQISDVIRYEEFKSILIFNFSKAATLRLRGRVLGGFDLEGEGFKVTPDPSRRLIRVKLPRPRILAVDPHFEWFDERQMWTAPRGLTKATAAAAIAIASVTSLAAQTPSANPRPRARELGIVVGILPPGPLNAITDVAGVLVGQATLIRGDSVRTGVTAVLPHGRNLFREKVPGAVFVGNGFGKLMGSTQVNELGEIETPILLTSTLAVPRVADALLDYMLRLPGNEDVRSINPLVAETNDGLLNDIRSRPISREDVFAAIRSAKEGPVEEGSVGAGTGTVAFGWKGGIGTSSRRLPAKLGGNTVGVLVQTNFGGVLTINGAPVGRELGRYYLKEELERSGYRFPANRPIGSSGHRAIRSPDEPTTRSPDQFEPEGGSLKPDSGSVIIVVATDAAADARNLRRLAARTMMGLARTGAAGSDGSGDYAIAFSTAPRDARPIPNEAMSLLFLAAIEATEEAIYNSLFRATTMTGRGRTVEALPIDKTVEILRRYGVIGGGNGP